MQSNICLFKLKRSWEFSLNSYLCAAFDILHKRELCSWCNCEPKLTRVEPGVAQGINKILMRTDSNRFENKLNFKKNYIKFSMLKNSWPGLRTIVVHQFDLFLL